MTLAQFRSKIRKQQNNKPRVYNATNSWGVHDAFNWYLHNKQQYGYTLKARQCGIYYRILRSVGQKIGSLIAKGEEITLPEHFGTIGIRKWIPKTRINKDGTIKDSYRVLWNETLKLWYEDEEAYKEKRLIKAINNTDNYMIQWSRDIRLKYNPYLLFQLQQKIKSVLGTNIRRGLICDAPMGTKYGMEYDTDPIYYEKDKKEGNNKEE